MKLILIILLFSIQTLDINSQSKPEVYKGDFAENIANLDRKGYAEYSYVTNADLSRSFQGEFFYTETIANADGFKAELSEFLLSFIKEKYNKEVGYFNNIKILGQFDQNLKVNNWTIRFTNSVSAPSKISIDYNCIYKKGVISVFEVSIANVVNSKISEKEVFYRIGDMRNNQIENIVYRTKADVGSFGLLNFKLGDVNEVFNFKSGVEIEHKQLNPMTGDIVKVDQKSAEVDEILKTCTNTESFIKISDQNYYPFGKSLITSKDRDKSKVLDKVYYVFKLRQDFENCFGRILRGIGTDDHFAMPILQLNPDNVTKNIAEFKANPNKPIELSSKLPEFNGGIKELYKFIAKNLTYPQEAIDNNVEGTLMTKFIINENGSISDVLIDKSLDKFCDKEALRVVKLLPNFSPAILNGTPIKSEYKLPINFTLN